MRRIFAWRTHELIVAIFLDERQQIAAIETVGHGDIGSVNLSHRRLFARARERRCRTFMLAHNHPTQNALPSEADIVETARIAREARKAGLSLEGHLIVTRDRITSIGWGEWQ